MNVFNSEVRRITGKLLLTVLLIYLILSIIVLQSGIRQHRQETRQAIEFSELQEKGTSQLKDINTLSIRGLRTISLSSPVIAIFSNSTPFKVLQSRFATPEILNIDRPQLGKSAFEEVSNKSVDLSWLIMMIGSLLVMGWGFGSFRNTEYIKFLMNFARPWQVFSGIILVRIIILTLYLAFLTGVVILQFWLNGMRLNSLEIASVLIFGLISDLVLIFMLIMGVAFCAIKNNSKAIIAAFVSWLCFTFFFPILINNQVSTEATSNTKSLYSHEMQKLDILLNHLNLVSKEISNLKSFPEKKEAVKKWNEIYWNSTFKKIERLESDMMAGLKRKSERLHLLNTLTPISFYSSVRNELSSRGYSILIDFYQHAQGKQKGFVRYYIDHIFDDYSKIEPYMKKEDYVFQARPSLPKYFGVGLLLNALYILALGFFSYFMFTRSIFKIKFKDSGNMKDKVVSLEEGSKATCITPYSSTKGLIFNYFSGQKPGFPGKIIAADKNVDIKEINRGFIYICHPDDFPRDIRVANLVNLIICTSNLEKEEIEKLRADLKIKEIGKKYLIDLSFREKIDILFAFVQVRKTETVLFNELDKDLMIPDWEILVEKLDRIKEDRYLLFMTKSAFFSLRMVKDSWSSVAENEHILKYLS